MTGRAPCGGGEWIRRHLGGSHISVLTRSLQSAIGRDAGSAASLATSMPSHQAIDSHSISFLLKNARWARAYVYMLREKKKLVQAGTYTAKGPERQTVKLLSSAPECPECLSRADLSTGKSSASCCWGLGIGKRSRHYTKALAMSLQLLVESLWPVLSCTMT